jgi:hypothetical protein
VLLPELQGDDEGGHSRWKRRLDGQDRHRGPVRAWVRSERRLVLPASTGDDPNLFCCPRSEHLGHDLRVGESDGVEGAPEEGDAVGLLLLLRPRSSRS